VLLKRVFDWSTMLHLAMKMVVTLSGLPCMSSFDCFGEPVTLAQTWDTWKAELKQYLAASGVDGKLQKWPLLLHLAGPGVGKIFKTYPEEVEGTAKEFNEVMTCHSKHFKVKKNVPLVRQKLLPRKPNQGEPIKNCYTFEKVVSSRWRWWQHGFD